MSTSPLERMKFHTDCRMPADRFYIGSHFLTDALVEWAGGHECGPAREFWCDVRRLQHEAAVKRLAEDKDRRERELATLLRKQFEPTLSRLRWITGACAQGGYGITESAYVRDGELWQFGGHRGYGQGFVIGTRPWTEREVAIERAYRAVRHGMADVLTWLGEKVGPGPDDPIPAFTGESILRHARSRGLVDLAPGRVPPPLRDEPMPLLPVPEVDEDDWSGYLVRAAERVAMTVRRPEALTVVTTA